VAIRKGEGKLCISHVKDIDGVSAAALARAATGCEFRLTDYDSLFEEMDAVPENVGELTLCDLGTDQSRFEEFHLRLANLAGRMKVTYIDHHYLADEQRTRLKALPITLVHNTKECAGMLTYLHFRKRLPEEAKIVSLYAAVTDYMDGSANARRTMERYDRHFVLLESTLLSYALARNGSDSRYARMLVKELARMRTPHQIEGVVESAREQADMVIKLAKVVRRRGKELRNLAFMKTQQSSTGNVAKLLLGAFDVQVGVAYKEKKGRAEMSLRSTSECKVHLGKAVGPLAQKYGGNGGGHDRAAGCAVPASHARDLITELDSVLSG
jgi:single-stranded DNA-specific DHH superfamily exonuclease